MYGTCSTCLPAALNNPVSQFLPEWIVVEHDLNEPSKNLGYRNIFVNAKKSKFSVKLTGYGCADAASIFRFFQLFFSPFF